MAWSGAAGILLFLLVAWNLWGVRQAYQVVRSDAIELQRHLDRVDYLDVELTHTAFMAAATGSLEYERVYRGFDAELVKTLAIVVRHAQAVGAGPVAARIYENADSLARLENSAFELVRSGRRGEAWALLNSPGYRYYKQRYNVIAGQVRERLQSHIDEQAMLFNRRLTWVSVLAVATLGLLIVTGLHAAMVTRRYLLRQQKELAQRRQTEEALRDSEERFRMLAEHSWDIVHVQNADTVIEYISPSVERMLGHAPEEMIGRRGPEFVHPDDRSRALQVFTSEVLDPGATVLVELRLRHKDGSWRTVAAVAKNIAAEGQPPRIVTYTQDVTERRRLEAELRQLALYDPLTGLCNRTLLTNRLEQAVRESASGEASALLFLDLDRFKRVNDSLGHSAGDLLLVEVARRLTASIGPGDTAARLGGDEFAVLIRGVSREPEVLARAERVQDAIEQPMIVHGAEVTTSATAGIALLDGSHSTPEEVLRDADLALYSAKAKGRGRSAVFSPSMHVDAVSLLQTENALRGALDRGEFRTCYQPIVSAITREVVGWEALVRWQHPTRGLLGPAAFLPIAEDSGLVVQIDRWVIRDALRQLREWRGQYPAGPGWYVSVNLSGRQFYTPGLVEYVQQMIAEFQVEPSGLHLEVTESILIDQQSASDTLAALKAMGVRIDLDDFGTGYSSLSYLHRFAVDGLKIDRSFVASMGENPESRTIVRSVLALAGSLGLTATAEGVETHEVADMLRGEGCSHLQGYVFSRPLRPADVEAWLASYLAPV
jgi:diguanylate cyclase (GGDEF)-like protein/PAS domain S-box-containing protein